MRRVARLLIVLGVLLLVGGCGASGSGRPARPAPAGRAARPARAERPAPSPAAPGPWHVVALGDSVTAGGHCGCTAFPQLYARDLARARGATVSVQNLGEGGQDTAGLLGELRRPGSTQQQAVRRADIALVTIGANDFGDHHADVVADRCALDGRRPCVSGELQELRRNMVALLQTIRGLRSGRPTAILVTGYWNVFEDGAVARRSFSAAGVRATRRLTFAADAVLREAALGQHATFVGLYAPFHGPAARGDVTHLLAPDGDHPDAAGQALIAQRLLAAGLRGLTQG
ncbi:MAG TPA: SGNH/GDSL hydrolase family protein [Marmoricola sp.]